jgi:serine beta-lactamase-like protein LACTB, mitochondrial
VQPLSDGSANEQGYALGWRYSDDKKLFNDSLSTRIYSHHGVAVGSLSYFAVYPDYGLVIALMANKSGESLDEIFPHANRIAEVFIAQQRQAK